ncbi:MAG: DUF2164 domain-containing protein [Hyphomonadaceae bacterium]
MTFQLEQDQRDRLASQLQSLFRREFDETLSTHKANLILDHLAGTLGPAVYNQAVQDVRRHLQGKLDDLDGEVYAEPSQDR